MKKTILLFLLSTFFLISYAQVKKVAVYVTGNDPINKVLSNRLVDGIVKSGKYIAVERTDNFMSELQKEQQYQQSGQVNDEEISRLGIQFGVNYVCVASIFDVWEEKYITVRLIDVETAEVVATASSNRKIYNSDDILSMLDEISEEILYSFEESKNEEAKKVAVYVRKTGNKEIDIVLGDVLVRAFARSRRFFAIERTNSFLNQISKEHNYQQSGNVSDSDLARLGRQSGVHYVCILAIDTLLGDYYISSRLISVETNEVVNSHNVEATSFSRIEDVLYEAYQIANVLSAMTVKEKSKAKEQLLLKNSTLIQSGLLVDLGLPSLTLWYTTNEGGDRGSYSFDEAVSMFGDKLPTDEQLLELVNECVWIKEKNGYKVVGPNGNHIFMQIGEKKVCRISWADISNNKSDGYYWSSVSLSDDDTAISLWFDKKNQGVFKGVFNIHRCNKVSVRLVED